MEKLKVKIKKLHEEAVVPKYATKGSAGFDFHALEDVEIYGNQTLLIKTGISVEIPEGFEIQVRPRSGLSLKTKLRIVNSPGTIDSDFRGEICIIMENTNTLFVEKIKKGDRIAQGVLCPVFQAKFVEEELEDTERSSGAFGSTGV